MSKYFVFCTRFALTTVGGKERSRDPSWNSIEAGSSGSPQSKGKSMPVASVPERCESSAPLFTSGASLKWTVISFITLDGSFLKRLPP